MSNTHFADDFDFENRIMDAKEIPEDAPEGDNPLRPKNLDEYIGQEKGEGEPPRLYRSGKDPP